MLRGSGAGARCTTGASEVFKSAVRSRFTRMALAVEKGTGEGIGESAGSDGCSVAPSCDANPRESDNAGNALGSGALFKVAGATATALASSEGDFFLTTTLLESAC